MCPIFVLAMINGIINTLLSQNTKLSTPNGMVKPTGVDLGPAAFMDNPSKVRDACEWE